MLDCVTLWIGDRLGAVERACMRSVLRQGHNLSVYCYQSVKGIPEGVTLRDAAEVLPQDAIFRHRSGSVAPFADWFRYELQRIGAGTWVDTDIYLVAPLDEDRPYLFGEQGSGLINNAVLRFPRDSPALAPLLEPFVDGVPRWLPRHQYWGAVARRLLTGRTDLSRLSWGATGPRALTAIASRFDLRRFALPPETFYPVPWERFDWIRDRQVLLADVVKASTVAVHLWNELIKGFKEEPAPEGSFLARLQAEGQ